MLICIHTRLEIYNLFPCILMIGIICMSYIQHLVQILNYSRINSHFVHCFSHVWADAGHRFTKSKHSF